MRGAGQPIPLHVAGREVNVWPRVSERSSRMRLSVKPGPRIVLSYPPHASHAAALTFLRDNLGWLERTLGRARVTQPSLTKHLERFPWITHDDRLLDVSITAAGRASARIDRTEDSLVLGLPAATRELSAVRAVRRMAESGLTAAVSRLGARSGVTFSKVTVRDQTTRWGSCSGAGALSLNWRLVLLPPKLHDHVILHELAHRRHMDHSDRFWGQLAIWDPDWRKHDRELTRRWSVIMDLGRES
ncbi:MAG: M48 family metallopeptidase [Opitutales bacterium]